MDVEDIAPGQRFAQATAETMGASDTVLIVVGPRWADILRQHALEPTHDYIFEEIEAALSGQVTIVPVLVGGAGMEQLAGLPESPAALSQYEAAELRDSSFSEDCTRLGKVLRLGLEPLATGKPSRKSAWMVAAAAAVLMDLGLVVIGPWRKYRARKVAITRMSQPPIVHRRSVLVREQLAVLGETRH